MSAQVAAEPPSGGAHQLQGLGHFFVRTKVSIIDAIQRLRPHLKLSPARNLFGIWQFRFQCGKRARLRGTRSRDYHNYVFSTDAADVGHEGCRLDIPLRIRKRLTIEHIRTSTCAKPVNCVADLRRLWDKRTGMFIFHSSPVPIIDY